MIFTTLQMTVPSSVILPIALAPPIQLLSLSTNVEFNKLYWSVLLSKEFVRTNTNLDVISCGLRQLLAEPGGVVEGTLRCSACSTVLAIPKRIIRKECVTPGCHVIIASLTEVVFTNK